MKAIFYTLALIICTFPLLQGQAVSDSVSTGAGYASQVWYSLDNGEVGSALSSEWDLAFETSGFGSGIRINGGIGHQLFLYTAGDTSAWNNVSTNTHDRMELVNSDTAWSMGAFNRSSDGGFDQGWGNYNVVTHIVTGDSIYVLTTQGGMVKKIWIESLSGGVYTFRHADLDGSNEMISTITKSDYVNENFGYFNLTTGTALSREPSSDAWDLAFTKYFTELSPGTFYNVNGVLSNSGAEVAQVYPVDLQTVQYTGQTMSSHINTIGHDWKTFDLNTFSYIITDSLAYFVKTSTGDIWKMIYTGFAGSSTGNVYFSKERLLVNRDEAIPGISSLTVYPNPSAGRKIQLLMDLDQTSQQNRMRLTDLRGVLVRDLELGIMTSGLAQVPLQLEGLGAGIYILEVQTEFGSTTQKIVLR